LEEQRTLESLQRALDTLSDDIAQLDRMAGDWAPWDDTYAFIQDANEDYIQSNLVDDTFINARLNLIAFVDRNGRIVYSKAYDFESKKETAVPQGLPDYLTEKRRYRPDERNIDDGALSEQRRNRATIPADSFVPHRQPMGGCASWAVRQEPVAGPAAE
jgi:sensor domain CHASE-containing protein